MRDQNVLQYPHMLNGPPNNEDTIRCTLNAIPSSPNVARQCRLPLAITVQPFRDQQQLHVVMDGICRCKHCRTYINPHIQLTDAQHWKCNLCHRINQLPDNAEYDYDNKQHKNLLSKPELLFNTVEYVTNSDYATRAPQPPTYLFVFEMTAQMVNSKFFECLADELHENLELMPGSDSAMIGFLGFDSLLHFFQFHDADGFPKHLISHDVDEVFLPAFKGFVVKRHKFLIAIESFLLELVQYCKNYLKNSNNNGSCLGMALETAYSLIDETGGRITVFLSQKQNCGIGMIEKPRNNCDLAPANDWYKQLALKSVGKHIGFDLFLFSNGENVDLATISEISRFTGGGTYFYSLKSSNDHLLFKKHIQRYLRRKIGFEAILRIRCSRGISVTNFYGNFFMRSMDLVAFPVISPDSAIAIGISVNSELYREKNAVIQAALLYTTSGGERRIRVHTICLPLFSDVKHVLNNFDVWSTSSLIAKMACNAATSGVSLEDCREMIETTAMDLFENYHDKIGLHKGWIFDNFAIKPKQLARFAAALIRNIAFCHSKKSEFEAEILADQRIALFDFFRSGPIEVVNAYLYPFLHHLNPLFEGKNILQIPLNAAQICTDGIYLMNCGTFSIIFVMPHFPLKYLKELFGVDDYNKINEINSLELDDSSKSSQRLQEILDWMKRIRAGFASQTIVLKNDSRHRSLFWSQMLEDDSGKLLGTTGLLRKIDEYVKN